MGAAIRPNDDLVLVLPARLEEWVPADHPVRFIRDVVDALDLDALGFQVRDFNEGLSPYSANLLLRVWLYGFFERLRSTRRLEWACRNLLPMIWLTTLNYPDHNTLWRFFAQHKAALRRLFKKVVLLAADAGLVGMVLHAVDGTKIQAAASTSTALHAETLKKALGKLDATIERMMEGAHDHPAPVEGLGPLPVTLAEAKTRRSAIVDALARLEQAGTERLAPADPEARMMQGRGTFPALSYNAQAVADAACGVIVAQDVVSDANDRQQLNPMLDAVQDTVGELADQTVADAGYLQGEQLEQAHQRDATIVLAGLQASPATASETFRKESFRYDAEHDQYICPRGQSLPFEGVKTKEKGKLQVAVYRCPNQRCPERHLCTEDQEGRTVDRRPFEDAIEEQRQRQQRDGQSRSIIALRKTLIEVVFAIVKWNEGFRRFTVKGQRAVRAQWALICTTYNLRKLFAAWRAGWLPPCLAT